MRKRTNYERGVEIERKIVKELSENGYLAICRSAGSHSFYDVYAVSDKYTLLIQSKRCKVLQESSYIEDIKAIKENAKNLHANAQVEFWIWLDGKGFVEKKVIKKANMRDSNGRSRSCEGLSKRELGGDRKATKKIQTIV